MNANDLPKNPRTYEPRATVGNEEIRIQAVKLEVMKAVKSDIERVNDESNLTKEEQRGKASLLRRQREGELVISMTDKSGKSVVCSPATYMEAVKTHTDKDEEASNKDHREINDSPSYNFEALESRKTAFQMNA